MLIKNYKQLKNLAENKDEGRILEKMIWIAEEVIKSAQPEKMLEENVKFEEKTMKIKEKTVKLERYKRHYIMAMGKAAQKMVKWFVEKYPSEIEEMVVAYPEESEKTIKEDEIKRKGKVKKLLLFEGGHPIPNEGSRKVAKEMLRLAEKIGKEDLWIILISGGGSAIVEEPDYRIKMEEYRRIVVELIRSGANIEEINTVRKHLSKVKGGKIAKKAKGKIITIAISDVITNDPSVIASGPTVTDKTTWREVEQILKKYKILDRIPDSIKEIIREGKEGKIEETPKNKKELTETEYYIIGDNKTLKYKVTEKIEQIEDANTTIVTMEQPMKGEVEKEAKKIKKLIERIEKTVKTRNYYIVGGGETTVAIRKAKEGAKGGRNQELAMRLIVNLKERNIYVMTIATDGIDGNSKAAGAITGPFTINSKEKRKKAKESIKEHNTNTFLKKYGGEIKTGYTGTNVADIIVIYGEKCVSKKI